MMKFYNVHVFVYTGHIKQFEWEIQHEPLVIHTARNVLKKLRSFYVDNKILFV